MLVRKNHQDGLWQLVLAHPDLLYLKVATHFQVLEAPISRIVFSIYQIHYLPRLNLMIFLISCRP